MKQLRAIDARLEEAGTNFGGTRTNGRRITCGLDALGHGCLRTRAGIDVMRNCRLDQEFRYSKLVVIWYQSDGISMLSRWLPSGHTTSNTVSMDTVGVGHCQIPLQLKTCVIIS